MFHKILHKTLEHEGYYAQVNGDRGGETYRGIARKFHSDWKGWEIIDNHKLDNKLSHNEKIDNELLDKYVLDFYFEKFWKKNKLDLIYNESLASQIFDFVMNAGANATKIVQRSINHFSSEKIAEDGVLGKMTARAINYTDSLALFYAIKTQRLEYYFKIAKYGKNQKFLNGWLTRADKFRYKV